jgi:hypothetical protein
MENPGVFFVPKRSIRGWRRRWRTWKIERHQCSPISIAPESDVKRFHQRLSRLAEADQWPQGERLLLAEPC